MFSKRCLDVAYSVSSLSVDLTQISAFTMVLSFVESAVVRTTWLDVFLAFDQVFGHDDELMCLALVH